jgi:hypothetical protein
LEARGGIEPPKKGFADPGLATWLPTTQKQNRNVPRNGWGFMQNIQEQPSRLRLKNIQAN